ncbi:hypothetical protein EHI8A_021930 [Entamoeba histolytica HM-1:IMSS-B]|uniref:Uncharacterized protein n=6 Tax=Entamoeba histolytica TaxID=5759 RepID=C4LWX3_ENTH1|nr:hypothetical protein EHI_126970 [Entamoeba histolytica HM-1:IMSS]EMD48653.1 Hypothetical protein EHI5A_012270 [Entamoeba histolytica KU27]EMH72677.1 hypothetical protein EHI8A_021930 [Entamoeba histolytica HM-1:IMSS-B]EMS13923.1 hypothetical protein KM1_012510 [Entamoeba histolytica HM-3:IMSS]ENY64655.1 hypothetical protein EHI7A_003260 [Entamoeba histolytica HM-1:IMSS-A]GAT93218.1 hypothetical protein CL6EHI_126970 [Entamoeba histolytica]|eukprot:XP_651548.1 hypothetical protein EHI_126970 [Entamoeba histolytica HM-1:IMSS]
MLSQRVKPSTNNVFHFFEYRQLEQFQNGRFDGIINFGDDKLAIKVNHNSYSTIRIETTSTYLYIPVSFESVYGKIEEYCYLSPGHIISVETQNNDPYTNKLVIYWDVERNGKSEIIDVGNKIISIAAHDGRIAVSVENVGILLYEITDIVKLIAKIQCKGGIIKIHRDYIINYVDHIVTIMDIRIVSRTEFFDNLGDPIVPDTKYRWNAVDIDVEVYGEKHITHAMTLMQERMIGLDTTVFIPQRIEEKEEGVRVVLGSQNKLEVYYISYNNSDLKITMISSYNFTQTKDDNKGKIVATPCHVLRLHQENGMSAIDIYPLRKYFSNQFEADMGKINEFRVGDSTTDLPCMSKINLPGITDLVVVNHKVVIVRSIGPERNSVTDQTFNEVFILEPLVVRLCQEIKNDMQRTIAQLKKNQDTCAIQIAISYKTYYELSVILEAYISDIHHFIRRKNNNWTDLYWRDVMSDEAIVVKDTLKQLYSIIAEELLDSKKGELAAYYFSKANTSFSHVVDRFIICEVKSCINLYFDEIFFKSNKEIGATLMATEYDKVFRLLESDTEKFIEITIQPAFQDHAKELNSLLELGKQRQKIKGIISQKRKGTKEQEAAYYLETCCVYAEYILMLHEQPQEASKIDIFKELNTRGSKSYEYDVINKYKSILFDTRGGKVIKQPIVNVIENNRPLLFIALMESDIELSQKYIDSQPTCEVIKLAAYEHLYKENKSYGSQLLEMYLKLINSTLEYPMHETLDKKYKVIFERSLNEINCQVPEWIPKELLTNIFIKKIISLLTQEHQLQCNINSINPQLQFIEHYAVRKINCGEFINFLHLHYKGVILGYIKELFNDQQALEKIAVEALTYEDDLRDTIFDLISTHLSIKSFCSIAAHAPTIDLSPFLRKCIGNSFYNKHLIDLCDAFPKE